MKKIILGLTILLFTSSAFAEGWSEPLTIENIIAEDTDIIILKTSGGDVYTNGCLTDHWIIRAETTNRLDRIYSTLMTALLTRKKVKIWFKDDCDSWTYHKSSTVMLLK